MSHKHLSIEERKSILKYITQGISINQIAKKIGRNKSSVSRDLKKNCIKGFYSPLNY